MTMTPHIDAAARSALDAVDGLNPGEAGAALAEALAHVMADAGCDDAAVRSFLATANAMLPGRVARIQATASFRQ